jgi:Sec-independent protein translocase protein TatA
MRNKILISFLFFFTLTSAYAQQSDKTKIRIVDTLTRQERTNRNPVISKAELDSMIQLHTASLPQVQLKDSPPVTQIVPEIPIWVTAVGIAALLLISILLYLLFDYHKRLGKTVGDLKRLIQNFSFYTANSNETTTTERNFRGKAAFEKKINEITTELEKEKAMNDELIEEYDLVKQSIAEVYKIRNYPLFDKNKTEQEIILDILKTEKTVASHAFEKYMKPLFAIADANKNNPAKLSPEDSEKMLELLVSMSLYYIEYLYLRVNDLAVGGNMVQRIGSNGKGIDPSLLKKLNIEHGSRALALRMALNKSGITKLSYPVFDETDLNNF